MPPEHRLCENQLHPTFTKPDGFPRLFFRVIAPKPPAIP